MTHLLDTNVCIVHLRTPQSGPIYQRLAALRKDDVVLCSVVVAELRYGALHSGSSRNEARVDAFLQLFASLPFDNAAARIHAEVREHLAKAGSPIGPHDLMIAAIALQHGLTVLTHNTREFTRVPGLTVEDWQAP